MITTHNSPKDFKKGKNATTKEALFKAILKKPYNTKETYKAGQQIVDNFVPSVCEATGEKCTTFTLKYGRRPLATFTYDEGEYETKENFITDVLAYAKKNTTLMEEVWAMHKEMAKTNGENAKGGTSLQVVS
jgi:hypothetical protein